MLYVDDDAILEEGLSTLRYSERKFLISVLISLSAFAFHSSLIVVCFCLSTLDCSVVSMACDRFGIDAGQGLTAAMGQANW